MKNHYRQVHLLALGALVAALFTAGGAQAQSAFQVAQKWPIQLGTSGGNVADRSRLYCCSGTLGALVEDGIGTQYILSNNHVLARVNQAAAGEDITQPGAVDQNCGTAGAVADYTACVPIEFWSKRNRPVNYVDAAIAAVRAGAVDRAGSILAIGQISSQPLADSVGLAVCKSGRTTGYTTGTITTVDVSVNVGYSTKCGSRSSLTASFGDQMVIRGSGGAAFSAGGDSGSLIVDAAGKHPVGLLFAGNSTDTIANPIGRVLDGLGVAMVGTGGNAKALATASDLEPVKAVKARHSEKLLDIPGVHGHGIGVSESGQAVIRVFVTKEEAAKAKALIPAELEGVPVEVQVTEPFVAF